MIEWNGSEVLHYAGSDSADVSRDLNNQLYTNMDDEAPHTCCHPPQVHIRMWHSLSWGGGEERWWLNSQGVWAAEYSRTPYDINIATYFRFRSGELTARKTPLQGVVHSVWTGLVIPLGHGSWRACQPAVDNTVMHHFPQQCIFRLMMLVRMVAITPNVRPWE